MRPITVSLNNLAKLLHLPYTAAQRMVDGARQTTPDYQERVAQFYVEFDSMLENIERTRWYQNLAFHAIDFYRTNPLKAETLGELLRTSKTIYQPHFMDFKGDTTFIDKMEVEFKKPSRKNKFVIFSDNFVTTVQERRQMLKRG